MPVSLIQTNFTAGELSERLGGRVDLSRWSNGVEIMENMVIHPHGGATRRPGLRFIHEVEGRNRLTAGDFSSASPWTVTGGWNVDTETGRAVCGEGAGELRQDAGMAEHLADIVRFTISDRTAGRVRVRSGSFEASPWVGEDGAYEILLKGDPNDPDLVFEADDQFLGAVSEVEVRRADPPARLVPFEFSTTKAYVLEFTDHNMRVYMDNGIVKDKADGGRILEVPTDWSGEDLDKLRWTQSADVMYLVHPEVRPKKLSRSSDLDWPLENATFTSTPPEWNDDEGYPSCCTFFEERLCFAASPSHPQRIWMSKSGDYENFGVSSPVMEDDACIYTLSADQVNRIRALVPGSRLMILTSGGEWWLSGGSGTDSVTPLSVLVRRETTHGSADMPPAAVGRTVIFLQRDGKKIRELAYALETDGYQANELSILSEHLTRNNRVVRWAFQQSPDSVLWMVRDDGVLLGMTYERSHDVTAFHRHTTMGSFEDVACIPGGNGAELWLQVRRTVNGSTRRFMERMDPAFDGQTTEDAFFVDSGLTYDGAPARSFARAGHLEGCTVQVLADGAVRPDVVIRNDGFTLNGPASKVHIGLPYESNLRTLRLEGGARDGGTAQGRTKRISNLTVRLYKSLGMKVGEDETSLRSLPFRTSAAPMGGPPALFSGDYALNFGGGYTKEGQVHIRQSQPLPLTVLALIPQTSVYGS